MEFMLPLLPRGPIRTGSIISFHRSATAAGTGEAACTHLSDGEWADFMIHGIHPGMVAMVAMV